MARLTTKGLLRNRWVQIRATPAAAVIAVDNATLTDINYPVAAAIDCSDLNTLLVKVEIDGGTAPTITLEPLFRDNDAIDGQRWTRIAAGAPDGVTLVATPAPSTMQTIPLTSGGPAQEIRVFGHYFVFFRIAAVAGTVAGTTNARILALPGQVRPGGRYG